MRYALRNQHKIEAAYDKKLLNRILLSLSEYFKTAKEIETIDIGEEYEIIVIDDAGHTVNMIAFYIIKKTFDTYRLAFKEFIG